jgi:hypothetical protein
MDIFFNTNPEFTQGTLDVPTSSPRACGEGLGAGGVK